MGTILMKTKKNAELSSKKLNYTEVLINMRHGIRTNRLGRPADERKALIRSLTTDVLTHGRVRTTVTRAKYIRKYVDRMITLSKDGTIHARRQMESFLYTKKLVKSIMKEAPDRYASRHGGYSRVLSEFGVRRG